MCGSCLEVRPLLRPPKYEPSSFPSHIFVRNGVYYFRANIPTDLQHHFPTAEIKKSLKTKDSKSAKVLALSHEYQMQRAYVRLRTGMLSDNMVRQVVSEILPHRVSSSVSDAVTPKRERLPRTVSKKKQNTLLSVMIKNYVADKEVEWTSKTKMEVAGVFKLLVDMLGDIDVCSISKPLVVELRSNLLKLPPNVYKKYPGKTIKQVLAVNSETTMSIKTVNKHVARLGSLLLYCMDENIISKNPASGLKISQKKKASEERSAYSVEDVGHIIKSLPEKSSRPERYWIPLIGLYSGLRLNEICQLYVNDIKQVDDVWCFDINNAGDKRLKNTASERIIPIHPVLVELGLIKYVEELKVADVPRLWMNLKWTSVNGHSNSFSNWYQRYNREYVTDDPLKVFHSMRHLVADTLKQLDVKDSLISEILGHAHASITTSRYGKEYQPKVMLEAMMNLDYGVSIPKWK